MAYNVLPEDIGIQEVVNQEYGNKMDGSKYSDQLLLALYTPNW